MEVPAQRIGHGLCFVVIVEARQLAPASVAAHLDETGAELHAKQQPAQQPHDQHRRRCVERPEKDRQKPGLEEQRLPAEAVEDLADVDDRQVQRPEREPHGHRHRQRRALRKREQHARCQQHAAPSHRKKEAVRVPHVEQARCLPERCHAQKPWCGEQAVLAEQWAELIDRNQERDEIDECEAALKDEATQPVVRCREPVHDFLPNTRRSATRAA